MSFKNKGSIAIVLTLASLLFSLTAPQFAKADDSPPITGLYISSSYEHIPAYQGNTNVYLEWTLWLERSYWDTHEISNVECTSTRGNCTSKGLYSPARIPPQGQIRIDSLADELPVDINLSVVTKLSSNPSETSTYTIIYTYKSSTPDFNYEISTENIGGGSVAINITGPLEIESRQYKTWFSCGSASGAVCDVTGSYNLELSAWIGQVRLINYIQGQNISVTINRHWATAITDFAIDGTYGSTVKKITIPTLEIGLAPLIGSITSEIDGCSFNITNYNSMFQFYFKRDDSNVIISDSGRVRLTGQLPGTTVNEYPSSRRTGYTVINNVSQAFSCTSLISEAMRNAELAAAARIARAQRIEKAVNELKTTLASDKPLNVAQLSGAELFGVTEKNIAGINIEIAKLDSSKKTDLKEIGRIVEKFATVDKVASKSTFYIPDLIKIGLVDPGIVNRASILRELKGIDSDQIDTFEKIQNAIKNIQEKIAARKSIIAWRINKLGKRT